MNCKLHFETQLLSYYPVTILVTNYLPEETREPEAGQLLAYFHITVFQLVRLQ